MKILVSLALAPLALGGATANAAAIAVLSSPQVAAEVVGVDVGGVNYNVTFAGYAIDHTFDSKPGAESGAAAQLATALNATTAPYVGSEGVGSINQFVVGNILAGGVQVASGSVAGAWQNNGFVSGDGSASVFTQVTPPTVVLASSAVVKEVRNLSVGGVLYNVTFAADAVDHTFDGAPLEQAVAVAELENALNGTTAPFVLLPGFGSINQFVVGDVLGGGTQLASNFQPGGWTPNGSGQDDGSDSVFTRVTVAPEPATWAMLLIGFAGLGYAGARRARAATSAA